MLRSIFLIEDNPSLILLGLKLPKFDGIEFLKIIRSTPSLVDIPVIILSSLGLKPDLLRSNALRITGYMTKPLNSITLKELLNKLRFQVTRKVDLQTPCSAACFA